MTDSKLPRPLHPEATQGQANAAVSATDAAPMRKRNPEEVSAQGEDAEPAQGADAAVAARVDAPVDTPDPEGAGSDAAVISGHGVAASALGSTRPLTLGGLGALGLVAAVASGPYTRHTDVTAPIQPTSPLQPETTQPGTTLPTKPPEPTTTPTTPVMPTVALATDSGTAGDGITNNGQVTVQVEAGNTWKYSLDNGATWADGSGDHIDASAFGVDGDKQVLVVQTNAAHLTSDATGLRFTLDTTAAPVQLALKNDTDTVGDGISSDGTVIISGLEDGATWRHSTDGGKTWNLGQGSEIADTRFEGKHEVQVFQTDKAGNDSAMSSLAFTLNTGAPTLALKNDTRPLLDDYILGESVTEERYLHDGITNDATVTVTGVDASTPWMYSLDQGQTWKTGSGNEIAANEFGDDGQKTVWTKKMVTTTSVSGISTFSFVLDTHVANVTPHLKFVDSTDNSGRAVTSNPVMVFSGYEEGALLSFRVHPPLVAGSGTSPITVMGAKELPLSLQPGTGYYLENVSQTDLAGNESGRYEASVYFSVTAPQTSDTNPPTGSVLP